MLAARIGELGLTEQELADRLNDAVRAVTGVAGKATPRYVRMLLDGTVCWPWPSRRQALEQVLGRPILELGFIPRTRRGHCGRDHQPTRPVPAVGAGQPPVMDPAGVAGGRVRAVDVPALPSGTVGFADLDRLAAALAQLHDLHGRHGPAGLAAVAARQATRLAAVHDRDMSGRVRAGLYALIGQWWATAAWLALDNGDEAGAGRHLQRALWPATIVRDPQVDAYVRHVMAALATHGGRHEEAATAASIMVRRAAAMPAGRWVAAAGHLHAAAAHAARGSLPRAELALDAAVEALRAAAAGGQRPPWWLARLGPWAVHHGRARAALAVGRYDLAATWGRQAADAIAPEQVWDHTLVLLDLAAARLGLREVEHAADHADTALDLARHLTDPFRSGPVAVRLERLATGFAAWPEIPRAAAWRDRYQTAQPPTHRHHREEPLGNQRTGDTVRLVTQAPRTSGAAWPGDGIEPA